VLPISTWSANCAAMEHAEVLPAVEPRALFAKSYGVAGPAESGLPPRRMRAPEALAASTRFATT
jgi:hypothetical protein